MLAWLVAGGIIGLNAWLLVRTVAQWGGLTSAPAGVSLLLFAITSGCGLLLLWIGVVPLRVRNRHSPPAGDGKQKSYDGTLTAA